MINKIIYSIGVFVLFCSTAGADVKTSKANGYTIVAPPIGVTASKVNAYTVTTMSDGVSSSKVNVYAVAFPVVGLTVSKVVAYTVVTPPSSQQPNVFIITKY